MRKFIIIHIFFYILISCQLAGKNSKYPSQPEKLIETTGSEYIGGSFSMTDHFGEKVSEKNYAGKYMLVFFGFSNCPSVCPMGLSSMGRVLNHLPNGIEKQITPIFVTVDPARDSLQRLAEFTKIFHPRLIGLRGSQKQTEDMVFKYRGYFRKVDNEKNYLMDHSDVIYLMDKQGKYLTHFSGAMNIDLMANHIGRFITID